MIRYSVTILSTLIVTILIVILFESDSVIGDFPDVETPESPGGLDSVGDSSAFNSIPGDGIDDSIDDGADFGDDIANDIEGVGGDDEGGGGGGDDATEAGDGESDEGTSEGGETESGGEDEKEEEEEDGDEASICMSTAQLIALIETITDLIEESIHSGKPYNPLEDPQVYQFWQ